MRDTSYTFIYKYTYTYGTIPTVREYYMRSIFVIIFRSVIGIRHCWPGGFVTSQNSN